MTNWKHIDKVLHFGIASGVTSVALFFGLPPAAALLFAWVLGGGKELYDRARPEAHTFDGWDAFWTSSGGLFAFVAQTLWSAL